MTYFQQNPSLGVEPSELCTMEVAGVYFSDWETVWVHNTWQDPNAEFRFTCAERDPIPDLWEKVQFKPRDFVKIWLGNIKAVEGVIIVRQVAYDANSHGVSLQGVGRSWYAARASILTTQNVNYSGSLVDIAKKLLAPTGVKLATIGNIPGNPFDPPVHPQPGETIFSFIERLAKDRNTIIGSTQDGAFLLIGEHTASEEADLVEGWNIVSAQVVIDDRYARDWYFAINQDTATDKHNMGAAAEPPIKGVPGDLPFYSPILVPLEHPARTPDEILMRAKHEQTWGMGEEITANITVQGWFNPRDKRLWRPGMALHVKSPMALLDMKLGVRSVTFTQDRQSGSKTTLDLVRPYRLKMYDDSPGSPSSLPSTSSTTSPGLPPVT